VGFGRGGHLLQRVIAVGFRGVVVEDPAEVGEPDELRQPAGLGGVDLPLPSRSSGGMHGRPSARKTSSSLRAPGARVFSSAGLNPHSLMLRPRPSARWRIATLCSLEPVKWCSAK
jgi:hypothetical protein